MSPKRISDPDPTVQPGPGDLYDVHSLAALLGLRVSTLRGYVLEEPEWLPPPARFGNKLVWPAHVIAEWMPLIEARPRPGRPARAPKPPLTSP